MQRKGMHFILCSLFLLAGCLAGSKQVVKVIYLLAVFRSYNTFKNLVSCKSSEVQQLVGQFRTGQGPEDESRKASVQISSTGGHWFQIILFLILLTLMQKAAFTFSYGWVLLFQTELCCCSCSCFSCVVVVVVVVSAKKMVLDPPLPFQDIPLTARDNR